MSRRLLVVLGVIALVSGILMAPVSAAPSRATFEDFTCEDLGIGPTTATTAVPNFKSGNFGRSRAWHVAEPAIVGAAQSFHLLDSDGNIVETFADTPGAGHDKNTTWCTAIGLSPAGPVYLGMEILFPGHG